jgi:hypothetical protein
MIIVDNIPQGTLFSIILFTFSETSITIPIGINIPNMAAKWPDIFRIYLSIIESIETNLNMPGQRPLGRNNRYRLTDF